MAIPPNNTFMSIPPPPLPEFYMPKKATANAPSSLSSTDDDGLKQHPPRLGDGTDERCELARTRKTSDVSSSLAVYHVCRTCLRPRSARYHRDHPIPIDGLPPPPGICRRCRVTSVDDSIPPPDMEELHESNGPKLGVKCVVADEDCFPARKARSRRVTYDLDDVDWRELESPPAKQSPPTQKEYVFKHIRIAIPPPPLHPPPIRSPPPTTAPPPNAQPAEPTFIYMPKPSVKSTAQDAIDSISEKSTHSSMHTTYKIRHFEDRAPKETPIPSKSDLRNTVRKRITTLTSSHEAEVRSPSRSSDGSKADWTERDIRRLARDEIERYRRAERRMDTHGDAYAHGRLVSVEGVSVIPVERRIETERDVHADMPWKRMEWEEEQPAYAMSKREYRVRSESQDRKEEILVTRTSGPRPQKETSPSSKPERVSPPSDASSDKTRWPNEETKKSIHEQNARSSRYPGHQRSEADRRFKHSKIQSASLHEGKPAAGQWAEYEESQVDTELHEHGVHVKHPERDYSRTARHLEHPQDQKQRIIMADDRRDPGIEGLTQHQGKQRAQQRFQQVQLPYPRDASAITVPMPSPSSHASRPAKGGSRDNKKSEYYYKLRTVQPADEATYVRDARDGIYCKEQSEYLHRRKPVTSPTKPEVSSLAGKKTGERRQSDVSSRVRFANEVAVSPTPPASDSSSAQYRRDQADEQGPSRVVDFEYERRGRASGHATSRTYDHSHDQDRHISQRKYRRGERSGAVKSALRGRQSSGDTETATVPSTIPIDVRMLARAQSESPSREKLIQAATDRREDGLGPFTVEHERSVSLEAYDGSSVGSDAAPPKHKQRRESRERAGQRGKR